MISFFHFSAQEFFYCGRADGDGTAFWISIDDKTGFGSSCRFVRIFLAFHDSARGPVRSRVRGAPKKIKPTSVARGRFRSENHVRGRHPPNPTSTQPTTPGTPEERDVFPPKCPGPGSSPAAGNVNATLRKGPERSVRRHHPPNRGRTSARARRYKVVVARTRRQVYL